MANPQEIVGDDWQEIAVPRFTAGLNLADQAELIDLKFFTRYRNVIAYRGRVQRDTGYEAFLLPVEGNPRKVFQHITRAGVGYLILITNSTIYRRNAGEWQYLSSGVQSTVAVSTVTATETTVDVAVVTGFSNGARIAIFRNDGTQHKATITNIAANVLTFSPAFTGTTANIGNQVIQTPGFGGTDDNHVVAVTVPWSDEMVFTNGVNAPQVFNPSTLFVQNLGGLPSSGDTICKSLALFDNSLMLLNTIEGGTSFPQRIRWSDRAAITVWTGGESGFVDLLAEPYHIRHGLPLGPYLFIYRTGAIYRSEAVNTATKRFTWDRMIANDGIFSIGGVIDLGDKHLYCGKDNFYEYRGGFDKVPVGDQIREVFFGNSSTLDKSKIHKLFMVNLNERREVLVFYQGIGANNPNQCYRYCYNLGHEGWGTRDFPEEFTGYGEAVETGTPVTWNTAIGTWANYVGQWNSSSLIGSDTSNFLCSSTNDRIYEYNFSAAADNGTPIQATLDTKDFSYPGWVCRLDHFDLKCSGNDIYCYYSLDAGNSWNLMQIFDVQAGTLSDFINPGTVPKVIRVHGKNCFERIRFRFESFNSFAIEWMKIRFIPDYEW